MCINRFHRFFFFLFCTRFDARKHCNFFLFTSDHSKMVWAHSGHIYLPFSVWLLAMMFAKFLVCTSVVNSFATLKICLPLCLFEIEKMALPFYGVVSIYFSFSISSMCCKSNSARQKKQIFVASQQWSKIEAEAFGDGEQNE